MAEQILLSPLMDEETGTLRSQASGARSQGWGGAKWALRETRPGPSPKPALSWVQQSAAPPGPSPFSAHEK